jgi:hypothetical protein
MYGLFCNTYDYYEWHDLICVSASEGDLIAHYESLNAEYPLLKDGDEIEDDRPHYVIEEVEVV